jgi:3-carboxy-cis,cis-muconate cycloisomerase
MSTVIIRSRLFGDMFASEAMQELFSDEALVQRYIDVEVALARAQGKLGVIPENAVNAIAAAADISRVDWDRLSARTRVVGYPILPLVEQMSDWAENGLGQYCHWGATTQDIMDTADVLQIRDALDLVETDLNFIRDATAWLSAKYATTPMAGRTHLQQALPITFGFKAARWLFSLDRHAERLAELRPRVLIGEFAGAAGTLASLGKDGLAVHEALMEELGLGRPGMPWHTARDSFAETTGLLAMICGTLGKIGFDIMLMMQSEIGEAYEPFVSGRGASSTMPQKRNPIASEVMVAAAKTVRECHAAMLDGMGHDHERATGPKHVEWQALPTAFLLTSGSLAAAREALEGLEVNESAMRQNLDATGGLIVAEAVMMGLAPDIGRQVAHDVVYDCCREALGKGEAFLEVLCAHPEISGKIDRKRLAELVDPANYLGSAPEMVEKYLKTRKA